MIRVFNSLSSVDKTVKQSYNNTLWFNINYILTTQTAVAAYLWTRSILNHNIIYTSINLITFHTIAQLIYTHFTK